MICELDITLGYYIITFGYLDLYNSVREITGYNI